MLEGMLQRSDLEIWDLACTAESDIIPFRKAALDEIDHSHITQQY